MNKVIRDQLSKVKAVKLEFNDDTTQIVIPKTSEVVMDALVIGGVYIVELAEELLKPSSMSLLESNWNGGKVPTHKYYKVEYLDKVGNMYKFNGIAYENGEDIFTEDWYGYFPEGKFKVVEKI